MMPLDDATTLQAETLLLRQQSVPLREQVAALHAALVAAQARNAELEAGPTDPPACVKPTTATPERRIRPVVVIRTISGGTQVLKGRRRAWRWRAGVRRGRRASSTPSRHVSTCCAKLLYPESELSQGAGSCEHTGTSSHRALRGS